LRELEPERFSACIRADEIRDQMATERARVLDARIPAAATINRVTLVEAVDVGKIFTRGKHRVVALNEVSIKVGENESVGLVGESGSGKTTLGRCLIGLETPTSGSIRIAGIDASNYRTLKSSDLRRLRQTVQIVFQDPYSSLNPVRTIGSVLEEAVLAKTPRQKNAPAAVRELLAKVGLPVEYAERKPVALSGGERQRVAIARALAVGPRLLICDEPVSALDVSVQAQILNLFESLRAELGMSYLFITHDLAVVRQVVERAYVLYKGDVVEAGPIDAVLDRPSHAYTQRLVDSIPRADETWLSHGPVAAT
jgi:peptide/nickel transport system ATP-binding protein